MELLKTLIWIVNIISAITIIVLVLMQHGKGADAGAAFGGGSAGSLFGASGSSNFLSRTTAVAAVIFFTTCLGLSYLTVSAQTDLGVMGGSTVTQPATQVPGAAAGQNKNTGPVIPE